MKPGKYFRDRLQRLYSSVWGPGPGLTLEREVAEIRAIGDSHDPAAVPSLMRFLSDPRAAISVAAADSIQRIVETCTPTRLAQLDAAMREASDWTRGPVGPEHVGDLAQGRWGVSGILSFERAGRVREAAVKLLASHSGGEELPFLILRLNDWVVQVRDAARSAVRSRIHPRHAPHFVRCLTLVRRLNSQSRQDHSEITASIFDLLRRPECRSLVRAALSSPEGQARRLAYRLITSDTGADVEPILEDALRSPDPVLRTWAARDLRSRTTGPRLRALLHRLASERLANVRREALYGFVEQLPEDAPDVLRAALVDPHPSLREIARFYLRQSGSEDFAEFYRRLLDSPQPEEDLAAAIAGVGETGSEADAALLKSFLGHPRSRVRRAVVRALGRLAPDEHIDVMLNALNDRSGTVVQSARAVLQPRARSLPSERLGSMLSHLDRTGPRRAVLGLIAKLQWWDSVHLLIDATGSDDPAIRSMAIGYLRDWGKVPNRLYVHPNAHQITALERTLAGPGARLDTKIRADVTSILSEAVPRTRT